MHTSENEANIRLKNGEFEVQPTLSRGEWGLSQDDAGRIYRNTNESALHVDLVPTPYFQRNPALLRTRGSYESLADENGDLNIVWPVRPNPGTNRAYQAGIDRDGRHAEPLHGRVCAVDLSRRPAAGGAVRERLRRRAGGEFRQPHRARATTARRSGRGRRTTTRSSWRPPTSASARSTSPTHPTARSTSSTCIAA